MDKSNGISSTPPVEQNEKEIVSVLKPGEIYSFSVHKPGILKLTKVGNLSGFRITDPSVDNGKNNPPIIFYSMWE